MPSFQPASASLYSLTHLEALNGVNSAGAILGCLTSAWTADKYSRKRTIELGCVVLIVGGALCSGSVNIGMCTFSSSDDCALSSLLTLLDTVLAGRVVAGIGAGILAVVVPMYVGSNLKYPLVGR